MTVMLALGGLVVIVVAWEAWHARSERRWRERHQARLAEAERRAQADGHPHSGNVTYLGRR